MTRSPDDLLIDASYGEFQHPGPRADLLRIGVDLDGTLAEGIWTPDNPTSEIGRPIWRNVRKVREAADRGFKPWIHTARPSTDYEAIEKWAHHYRIPISGIETGKPLFVLYIDDRGRHESAESWLP